MLFQCWPTVFDVGPTLKQHWSMPRVSWEITITAKPRAVTDEEYADTYCFMGFVHGRAPPLL